jgi:hypothetical protein
MANTFTVRKLIDGPRHTVIHAYMASDGSSGELTDQVLVDASTLDPVPTKLVVECVKWNLDGFTATLEFDATADVPFMVLDSGSDGDKDFRSVGGLVDNSGVGSTGDITITSDGFSTVADNGSITIQVRKNF